MGNARAIRFVTVPLAVASADALPARVKILNWGDNPNVNGARVHLGATAVAALAHPLNAWKRIALDFEHNTLPGTPAFNASKEPRPVAGFGMLSIVPGDGAYLEGITYTPEGQANAANYAGLSAGPVCDREGNVQIIMSAALVRNSAVPGMDFKPCPLSASADEQMDLIVPAPENRNQMNYKDGLCKMLDLDPATATDEEIEAALEKRKAPKPAAVPLSAEIAIAIGTAMKPLTEQLATLKADIAQRDKNDLLAAARHEGKVVALSADAIGALSLDHLKQVIEKTPVTVPLSARTPGFVQEPKLSDGAGPTDADRQIARNCGVDPEKVWPKKAGGIGIRFALAIAAVASLLGTVGVLCAADRDTPERDGVKVTLTAGAAIDAGVMVAVSNLVAFEAADLAGYVVLGRSVAAAAAGASVTVKRGVYRWDNDGVFTIASVGTRCYVSDEAGVTTAAIAAQDIPAGYITDVDSTGVWVDTYHDTPLISTSVASLTVAGALTVGTTIDGDSITVDAGAGLDTQEAGALVVGAATATSLTLGASDITTAVAGPLTAPRLTTVADATATRICTAADYGKLIMISSNAAVAVTLPANGAAAGSWIDFMVIGNDSCAPTVAAATADTLITLNSADSDSVTFGSGHRIGAYLRCISNGSFWLAINLSQATMTVNDSD